MSAIELDPAKVEAFAGKVVADLGTAFNTRLAAIGDRLGLFGELDAGGAATSEELAQRAGISERYAREWLRAMTAQGYLEHDRTTGSFSLPAEHAMVLAQEGGPAFLGGGLQMQYGLAPLHGLTDAFRDGGGMPQSAYGQDWWSGMERFTSGWFENLLLQEWLPKLPDVTARLEQGATVVDVGCGAGRAVLKLAEAFPSCTLVGLDAFQAQVDLATANAHAAGVADRVSFAVRDVAAEGLGQEADIVTTFDVVHDAVDPRGLLRAIREGLRPDGTYLMLEMNAHDDPADNVGPIAAMLYGVSVEYCMTTSLAHGGEGLGTCGMPPGRVSELSLEAGFGRVDQVEMDNPFNTLFAIRP